MENKSKAQGGLNPSTCPCGSGNEFSTCCGPLIEGKVQAENPEQLMRSRYSAYTVHNIDYVFDTMTGDALEGSDREESLRWAQESNWLGLEIVNAPAPGEDDTKGIVEFVANYEQGNHKCQLKEKSHFEKIDGRWFYTGLEEENTTVQSTKIGRNEPCPCGSGKKYKKCCLK